VPKSAPWELNPTILEVTRGVQMALMQEILLHSLTNVLGAIILLKHQYVGIQITFLYGAQQEFF
jgi:hypothetical protein